MCIDHTATINADLYAMKVSGGASPIVLLLCVKTASNLLQA